MVCLSFYLQHISCMFHHWRMFWCSLSTHWADVVDVWEEWLRVVPRANRSDHHLAAASHKYRQHWVNMEYDLNTPPYLFEAVHTDTLFKTRKTWSVFLSCHSQFIRIQHTIFVIILSVLWHRHSKLWSFTHNLVILVSVPLMTSSLAQPYVMW